jgi:prepilin-type N-terminal cleavage/methylation domain-containing protein
MDAPMVRPRLQPPLRRRVAAFSIIELLIVLAILGLIAGVVAVNGRRVLAGQQEKAALNSVRQSVWEGATAAAARGTDTELVHTTSGLEVREVGSATALRTFALPASVTTNLPAPSGANGTVVLKFTPPGRVDLATLRSLPDPLTLTVNGHTFKLQVSLIGEVKVTS